MRNLQTGILFFMPREKTLESIIIKKQDFGETDQIVTLFSREEGKLRCLAKAAKMPTSRLQPSLQPLFLSKVTLAGAGTLPKVIRVQPMTAFSGILLEQHKIGAWFVLSEIIMRALPDGAPNVRLFSEALDYLKFINAAELSQSASALSTVQFQLKALEALGFGVRVVQGGVPNAVWFSMDRGGFFPEEPGADAESVSLETYQLFLGLLSEPYALSAMAADEDAKLEKLVSRFVTYQLEREIKSAKFL